MGQDAARADWDNESQRLWQTFRSAYITICAASSTSCRDSFLKNRRIHPGLLLKLRIADGDENSAGSTNPRLGAPPVRTSWCKLIPWQVEDAVQERLPDGDCSFLPKIINSRWYSRGWVHQEISFSQRLLVFGTNMLYMRCGDWQACENGWHNSHRGCDREYLHEMNPNDLRTRPFEVFAQHVESYYPKQLTVETDRLPAMAALASKVAGSTGSDYLAGLWRDNLANDLLFSVSILRNMPIEERIRELAVPESNARPSWSWAGHSDRFRDVGNYAGHTAALIFLNDSPAWNLDMDCVVVDADAKPAGGNPFGAVGRAHLTLRCRMVVLEKLLQDAGVERWDGIGHNASEKELALYWDTNHHDATSSLDATVSLICTSERPPASEHFYFEMPYTTAGLIVYPAAKDGEYYRVGVWQGYSSSCAGSNCEWETQTVTLV